MDISRANADCTKSSNDQLDENINRVNKSFSQPEENILEEVTYNNDQEDKVSARINNNNTQENAVVEGINGNFTNNTNQKDTVVGGINANCINNTKQDDTVVGGVNKKDDVEEEEQESLGVDVEEQKSLDVEKIEKQKSLHVDVEEKEQKSFDVDVKKIKVQESLNVDVKKIEEQESLDVYAKEEEEQKSLDVKKIEEQEFLDVKEEQNSLDVKEEQISLNVDVKKIKEQESLNVDVEKIEEQESLDVDAKEEEEQKSLDIKKIEEQESLDVKEEQNSLDVKEEQISLDVDVKKIKEQESLNVDVETIEEQESLDLDAKKIEEQEPLDVDVKEEEEQKSLDVNVKKIEEQESLDVDVKKEKEQGSLDVAVEEKQQESLETICLINKFHWDEKPLEETCLDKADFKEIIKNATGNQHELLAVKWEQLGGKLRGYTGHHRILKLKIRTEKGEEVLRYFVKTLIGCSYSDDAIFKKEIFAYEFVETAKANFKGANLDVTPRMVYYGNQTVVLEDLSEDGYKGLDGLCFDKAHMLKALESLAKFHALSIVYEELKGKDLGREYRMIEDYYEVLKPRYCKDEESAGFKYVKSCYLGAATIINLCLKGDYWRLKNDEMFKKFLDLLNEENGFRKTFCHGDVWANNLMFKYDCKGNPIKCKLVDLQLNRYTPPAHDVTMLIYMASPRRLYHSYIQEYYDHYYRNLGLELKNQGFDIEGILSKQEFAETCKICMPIAKYIWLFYSETMQASNAINLKIATDPDYAESAIFGPERVTFVKDNYTLNSAYKKYMHLLMDDFKLTHASTKITLEECCAIANKKLGGELFEIVDYTLKEIDLKSGYLGDHYDLFITLNTGVTSDHHFFVKLIPDDNPHKQEFLSKSGADFKEMRFFSRIIPDLESHGISTDFTPKAYLAKKGVLVLDNLRPKGYTLTKIRESLNLECVKLGLEALANLHATGIILEEKLGKNVRLSAIYPAELKEALYIEEPTSSNWLKAAKLGAQTQAKMYSNYTSAITLEEFVDFIADIFNNYDNLVKPSTKHRNSFSHGDIWTNNLMFKENNCKLIDFQFYRYAPPARDFMQFIHITTNRDFRDKYMRECKEYYHKKLEALFKARNLDISEILAFPDFLDSCEEEKVFTLSQTVIYYQHLMATSERAQEKLFDDMEYFQEAFLNDRSEFVRSTSEMDPVYKRRNQEAIKDLREYCEGIFEKKSVLPLGFEEKYVHVMCNNL